MIQLDQQRQGGDQEVVGEPRYQTILVNEEGESGSAAIMAKDVQH